MPTAPFLSRFRFDNVRIGFATNSSSTHSIIIVRHAVRALARDRHVPPRQDDGQSRFDAQAGYLLATESPKTDFLAGLLYANLADIVPCDVAEAIADSWTGQRTAETRVHYGFDLPRSWDGRTLHRGFLADFERCLRSPASRVRSSPLNDTLPRSVQQHQDAGDCYDLDLPQGGSSHAGPWVARREPSGHWVLFQRGTGTRLTVALDPALPAFTTAGTPMLVDVKITDHCRFGCAFCYQNSTPRGAPADAAFLDALWPALARLQVFEVALGGGEPTTLPGFGALLKRVASFGIVPNFSTKSLTWLKQPDLLRTVDTLVGGVAFSVTSAREASRVARALLAAREALALERGHDRTFRSRDGIMERASLQVVLGVPLIDEFVKILAVAAEHGLKVTVLGYKTDGRGSAVAPHPHDDWLVRVRGLIDGGSCPTLGIDTTVAQRFADDLAAAAIPDFFLQTQEGAVSMYVDAVTRTIAPASFGCADRRTDVTADTVESAIRAAFPYPSVLPTHAASHDAPC